MDVATKRCMDPDLRYERPCRWLLAVGGAINWVAAALVISGRTEVVSANEFAWVLEPLLSAIAQSLS